MIFRRNLIHAYAHLPQKVMYLSNPPEDITKDKYIDIKYLTFCKEMIEELSDEDFNTRDDGVHPYSKNILIKHFKSAIKELKGEKE